MNTAAEELPPLRGLLPDDPRLNLLEVLEFRNAAHLEDLAGSLNHLSEQVPGALDDSTHELKRIADAFERFNKLLVSVIGEGLIDAGDGTWKGAKYIRAGDGNEFFNERK